MGAGGRRGPLPAFDVHCPLLSLPGVFNTRVETIPAPVPSTWADPVIGSAEAWGTRMRVSARPAGLKVALAWAGNPVQKVDPGRSLVLSQLARRLGRVPGVRFYSVQKGYAAAQAAVIRPTAWS